MSLTPWFPAAVKPVRKGVYERKYAWMNCPMYSYWDGHTWYVADTSINKAVLRFQSGLDSILMVKWRGLADKPT
jgi:hypothetical protein